VLAGPKIYLVGWVRRAGVLRPFSPKTQPGAQRQSLPAGFPPPLRRPGLAGARSCLSSYSQGLRCAGRRGVAPGLARRDYRVVPVVAHARLGCHCRRAGTARHYCQARGTGSWSRTWQGRVSRGRASRCRSAACVVPVDEPRAPVRARQMHQIAEPCDNRGRPAKRSTTGRTGSSPRSRSWSA